MTAFGIQASAYLMGISILIDYCTPGIIVFKCIGAMTRCIEILDILNLRKTDAPILHERQSERIMDM